MEYNVPGVGEIEIKTIALDLNGTLTLKGKLIPHAVEYIQKFQRAGIEVVLVSSDQRGNAQKIADEMGIHYYPASNSAEKEEVILNFDTQKTVAIGNGQNDIGMFKHAKVSIALLQSEGVSIELMRHTDIAVPSIIDAFEMLLAPDIFIATMRK